MLRTSTRLATLGAAIVALFANSAAAAGAPPYAEPTFAPPRPYLSRRRLRRHLVEQSRLAAADLVAIRPIRQVGWKRFRRAHRRDV